MKAIKIAALVGLVLWMGWITWRIEEVRNLAVIDCRLVYTDLKNKQEPEVHHAPYCPPVFLYQAPDSK